MLTLRVDDTTRLTLPSQRHIRPAFEFIDAERDRFARWFADLPETVEQQADRHHRILARFAAGTFFPFVIEVDGEYAGSVGIRRDGPEEHVVEFGYLLAGRFAGRGIMRRCVRTVIDYGIRELGVHRFEICCAPENERSQAIPRHLGFHFEGTKRDAVKVGGEYQDQQLWSLLAPE